MSIWTEQFSQPYNTYPYLPSLLSSCPVVQRIRVDHIPLPVNVVTLTVYINLYINGVLLRKCALLFVDLTVE